MKTYPIFTRTKNNQLVRNTVPLTSKIDYLTANRAPIQPTKKESITGYPETVIKWHDKIGFGY